MLDMNPFIMTATALVAEEAGCDDEDITDDIFFVIDVMLMVNFALLDRIDISAIN